MFGGEPTISLSQNFLRSIMDFKNIEETYSEDEQKREAGLNFYYNREERLKNAPQIVRDYYDGKMNPTKGLFRVLVSTKQNKFLLLSIFIFAAFIWIFNFFSNRQTKQFLGTYLELQAFSYEDDVYASLKFDEIPVKNRNGLTAPVQAVFYAYDNSGLVSDKAEVGDFFSGNELFLRTKFKDYDIIKVICEVSSASESRELTAYVKR